jgi:methionyl-tRNA formyltransferase
MKPEIKIIFFGTPDYVIPILERLNKTYKVVAVVTQPPKEVGRKKVRTFSAVDSWAHKKKIQVITNLNIRDFPEANLGVVASYGKIIPIHVINYFANGILNIHPSLLPKYRGASPIQSQIVDNVTQTGVTVIKMDAKMDHGPIISQFAEQIDKTDTNETLRNRLFERSAQFLVDLIPNYLSKKITPKPQDETQATFTKIISREDGFVTPATFTENPEKVERMIRAYKPWPGVYTIINNKRLRILEVHMENNKLILDKVQIEGKKQVSFEEFKRGYPEIKLDF